MKEYRNFTEFIQEDIGGYPLRSILDNLDEDQILECIEEYIRV